jgi:hypothetical protein
MKTKFRGFIQYVTTARSLTGRPRLASPGASSRTSLIVVRGRRLMPSPDPEFPVTSDGAVRPSTGRTIASSRATISLVCTTKPSRSIRTSGRVISSILTGMLPVPSSIDDVPPGCWVIVPCTRTRCLEVDPGVARSRVAMACTGTENGSDGPAKSTWMSSRPETRICGRTAWPRVLNVVSATPRILTLASIKDCPRAGPEPRTRARNMPSASATCRVNRPSFSTRAECTMPTASTYRCENEGDARLVAETRCAS